MVAAGALLEYCDSANYRKKRETKDNMPFVPE
jgi:hypothetical protein